jgi:hypothetical protein
MSRNREIDPLAYRESAGDHIDNLESADEELLTRAVLQLSGNILGLVLGILASLVIFVATNWLVIKGGPVVGPHLSLLSQYFIGFSVSFVGSLIGMAYAFIVGYLSGISIAWVYNRIAANRSHTSN